MSTLRIFCSQCGGGFLIERRAGRRTRFCSETCRRAWGELNRVVETEMQCTQCGSMFQIAHRRRGPHFRFCSEACRVARKAAQVRRYHEEGRYQHARESVVCGRRFTTRCTATRACSAACGQILAKRSRPPRIQGELPLRVKCDGA